MNIDLQTMKTFYTKIFFVFTLFSCLVSSSYAQLELGAGLAFGTLTDDIGIFVKGRWKFTDQIAISPNITYFFVEDVSVINNSFWTINVDGHYLFQPQENIYVYPLAGLQLGIFRVSFDDGVGLGLADESSTTSELGLNLGGGGQIKFTDTLSGVMEIKYVLSDFDQLVISAGVLIDIK